MSISFSGLASGLDTESWISALVSAKQSSQLTPLKTQYNTLNTQKTTLSKVKNTYSSLMSATQTFTDAKFGASKDVFASNQVSVSDSKKLGATVTSSTPRQTLSVEILQLATPTKVTSQNSVATLIDENTPISTIASGSVKGGTFSFYVDGKRYETEVSPEYTLGTFAEKIESIAVDEYGNSLIDVDFVDGKFTITSTQNAQIRVGSNSDTSNLISALALKSNEDGTAQSAYAISALNLNEPLLNVESGFFLYDENGEKIPSIKPGTFTIGSAEITITETTTMNELISKINSSTNANATAFFDSVQNKMVITSKQDGAFNVNIEGGTSNITDMLGLTQNGNIIQETQELGQNSKLKINGSEVESYSNTITSEVSGIAGLTLELNEITDTSKPINITIGQDTNAVITKLEELVKAINTLISTTDSATASGGALQYDSSLNSLRSDIRTTASTGINSESAYRTLASIGITTGEFGTDVEANTNQFQIDKSKLTEALNNDPNAVKTLLIGDESQGITGIIEQLQKITENALDIESGFFSNRETTLTSQITSMNSRIDAKTAQIENYQAQLEKKFQAMEKQIASLQTQQTQMSSILTT